MKLLVDQGNTRTKWQLVDNNDQLAGAGSYLTKEAFPNSALPSREIEVVGAHISSVADHAARNALRERIHDQWGIDSKFVTSSDAEAKIKNSYHSKETLGIDRLIAAVGARELHQFGNVVVIDAGTAVTIDLLTDEGGFEGGVIMPGFDLMRDSLVGNTAGIRVGQKQSPKVVGKTTSECVHSGSHFGVIGGIEKVVSEILAQTTRPCKVLICGGDAAVIHQSLSFDAQLQADLIFLGLLSIGQY